MPMKEREMGNSKTQTMKKLLLTVIAIACAASLSAMAQEKAPEKAPEKKAPAKKAEMTAEQKAEYKKLVEKYDTITKDGKLDKEERAKMTQEDKDAMRKLTGGATKKKAQ
jgi:hypothetical protein